MSIERLYDFRGGYASSTPPELMANNMVVTGTNLYYDSKLKKRPSWSNYVVATAITSGTVRGMCACYINSAWETVLAIDTGPSTSFYTVASATTLDAALTTPSSVAFTMEDDHEIDMVAFDNMVVVVDTSGTDKPAVIYYDGTKTSIENLETYDSRSRGNDDWYAGQYDASGATPDLQFIDDTEDAQDAGANDFQITSTTNSDGFYVAGVLPFTKVVLTNADAFAGGEPSDETYKYYAGSGTWTAVTLVSSPTWATGSGDKTIEFNIPLDSDGELAWKAYGDVSTDADPTDVPGGTLNRYILKVEFPTAPSNTPDCDKLTVSHDQYLTQLFQGDKPDVVCVHGDRCFLAAGNVFAKTLGGVNGLKGWSSRDFEYTDQGGTDIVALYSGGQFLAVIKDLGYYRYYGTTTSNALLRYGGTEGGISSRGVCGLKDGVAYLGKDGVYFMPYQGDVSIISKTINADLAPAQGDLLIGWEGNLLMSDPSASTMWWADPDTLRQDDMGDSTLSWWKWTGQNAKNMIYDYSIASARTVMVYDATNTRLVKNGELAYDTNKAADTNTNIACTLQTKYYSFGTPLQKKKLRRIKVDLSKSGDWTLNFVSDNGTTTSASYTIASATGSGHYYEDISIPWENDGYNIAFKLVNQTANAVEIYGFAVELEGRMF